MENDLLSDSIAINCYSDMVHSRHTRIHPLEGKYEDIKTHHNTSACVECGQYTTRNLLAYDPVVSAYRIFFSLFDWSLIEHWQEQRPARGRPAHPESAYLKALLVRINEGLLYSTHLRANLVNHPLLVIELGFHLELDPRAPYWFDVERTLPCRYWLGEKLHRLDRVLLQDLLAATVAALQEEFAGLGETVAFDVKHIYGWVKENNERVYVTERYDKTRRPAGDPDCKLGVKHEPQPGAAPLLFAAAAL